MRAGGGPGGPPLHKSGAPHTTFIPELNCLSIFHVYKCQRRLKITFVSFYRRNLPHVQKDFVPHFITFVTSLRRTLPPSARDIVLESCIHGHGTKYNLYIAMVMPDHAHLILTPLIDIKNQRIYPLCEIMRAMKSYSARRINERLGGSGQIWLQESFDHVLRSSESLDAKIAYVLANPVRAGLVRVPEEYRWAWMKPVSNFREHVPAAE